jgi:hypothetical protein
MLRQTLGSLLLLGLMAGPVLAQQKDDFKREGNAAKRALKDPLEGKSAPALQVKNWMNTKGKALKLSDFKGKVVVLDFWGVW